MTRYSVPALLLCAQSIMQHFSCEREGFVFEETTEIILSISVSNYIVTTSLVDGWPKTDFLILY